VTIVEHVFLCSLTTRMTYSHFLCHKMAAWVCLSNDEYGAQDKDTAFLFFIVTYFKIILRVNFFYQIR